MKDLTVVVPVYNEVENVRPLMDEITAALADQNWDYEVLFIDDGSKDGSFEMLKAMADENPRIVVVRFRRNHGQTAGFAAGFDYAEGNRILTMDADRQNDPADIPKLMAKMDEGYDVVNGWRQNRQDAFLMRKVPSFIANRLIAKLSDVPLKDRGCSLRLFKAKVVEELHLYGEFHRFIPEMVSFAGFTMAEVPVNHRPRVAGEAKYGISRTFRVLVDLVTIVFLRKYMDRPMHFFGLIGVPLGAIGGLLMVYLLFSKAWAGITSGWESFHAVQIGELLILSGLLIVLGMLFLAIGLLAELIARTYYETQDKTVYYVKEVLGRESQTSLVRES